MQRESFCLKPRSHFQECPSEIQVAVCRYRDGHTGLPELEKAALAFPVITTALEKSVGWHTHGNTGIAANRVKTRLHSQPRP